jgi:hypothetical protein
MLHAIYNFLSHSIFLHYHDQASISLHQMRKYFIFYSLLCACVSNNQAKFSVYDRQMYKGKMMDVHFTKCEKALDAFNKLKTLN